MKVCIFSHILRASLFFILIDFITLKGCYGQNEAVVLEHTTRITVNNGSKTTIDSYLIQVNNKASAWISDLEVSYSENESLDIVHAYIINKNGEIVRKLKARDIEETSDNSESVFYEDHLIKKFSLRWNEYPYRISYSTKRQTKRFVFVTNWFTLTHYNIPCLKSELVVEVPEEYKIAISESDSIVSGSNHSNGIITYFWKKGLTLPIPIEPLSPPRIEMIPNVKIVPLEFKYGTAGSFRSWNDYGQWHYDINENLLEITDNEKSSVDRLFQEPMSTLDSIKTLYYYLQDNTRYINVSIDEGGLMPYSAAYVCEKKYGDCKALTIYMMGLLKHIGVHSNYVIISAGQNNSPINPNLPSQQFNHVFTSVPINGDTLWLENTANYLPFNYVASSIQARRALFITKDQSQLIYTPSMKSIPSWFRTFAYQINEIGEGSLKIHSKYNNEEFEKHLAFYKSGSIQDQRRLLENHLSISNSELLQWKYVFTSRDSSYIELVGELNLKNQMRRVADKKIIYPPALNFPKLESPTERINPVLISKENWQIDTINYVIQAKAPIDISPPKDIEIISDYGHFKQKALVEENRVLLIRDLKVNKGRYNKGEYSSFYAFITEINEYFNSNYIIYK